MDKRAIAIAELRARKRIMELAGHRPRRRKMPRQLHPTAIQLAYYDALRTLVRRAQEYVRAYLFPALSGILDEAAKERGDSLQSDIHFVMNMRSDAAGRRVQLILDRIAELWGHEYPAARVERLASEIGERTSKFQRDQLFKQIKAAVGIDLGTIQRNESGLRARIAQFAEGNVSLIETVPKRYFDDIENRVMQGIRGGERASEITTDLEETLGPKYEERAKLIARDQVTKFYGELNQVRQENLGIDSYTWRTVHDNRVRSAHEDFDGKVYTWAEGAGDGSPEEGIHPGDAINCRCYADPNLDGILEEING